MPARGAQITNDIDGVKGTHNIFRVLRVVMTENEFFFLFVIP